MIDRVFDLQNARVGQITVPLSKVVSVPATALLSEVLALCRQRNLTRLPVLDAQTGRITGIIDLERILYRSDLDLKKTAGHYLAPALFVPESLLVEEVLRRLQRSGGRMAIVLDRTHHEIGIVSLQDILRVIFGEVTAP